MTFNLNDIESLCASSISFTSLKNLAPIIFDALPCPIFIKNNEARFIFINKSYENHFGVKKEDILGKTVMNLEYLEMEARVKYHHEDMYGIRNTISKYHELDYTFIDGLLHHCMYWSCGFYDKESNARGLVGFIVDISSKEKSHKNLNEKLEELTSAYGKLEDLAIRDPLTGLKHRRGFTEYIIALSELEGKRLSFCLILIDIDFFKKVNDTFGHSSGDEVLKNFVGVLLHICREKDSAYRWGGEEFLVILPNTSLAGARRASERLRTCLNETSMLDCGHKITVSGGIVEYRKNETIESLIKRADLALYEAKSEGRDRFIF